MSPRPPPAPPLRRRSARAAPPPITDALFGDFWPERVAARQRSGCCSARSASACWPGSCCPTATSASGCSSSCVAAGGVLLASSRNRRDPFTLTCAALCLALATVPVVRDAEWIAVLCLLAGGGLCAVGLVRGRTVRASSCPASPGRSRASAACRGWAGPCGSSPGSATRPRGADRRALGHRARRLRTALRVGRRAVRRVGRRRRARLRLRGPRAARVRRVLRRRGGARRQLPRPQPADGRRPRAGRCVRWPTGSSGSRRCWSSTPCSCCSWSRRPRSSSAGTTTSSARPG